MQKILILTCLILQSLALVPFGSYRNMCLGKINCYALFNDTRVSGTLKIDYSKIERYPRTIPYYTGVNMNIGWAQSHSMAFTYRIWNSYYSLNGVPDPNMHVIADLSFVKIVLENNFTDCRPPQIQYPDATKSNIIHLPLFYSKDYIHPVVVRPAYYYDESTVANWCNLTHLKSQDVSKFKKYIFTGYDNYLLKTPTSFSVVRNLIRTLGIGIVAVPHDNKIAEMWPSYPDGFYRLSGPMIYYYPANVVGCYAPGNGTVYLIVYMFGAQNHDINYLFVDFAMVSLKNWITMIYQVTKF